jgi:hypothetical protein
MGWGEPVRCGSGWTLDGPPGPSSRCVVDQGIARLASPTLPFQASAPFWTFVSSSGSWNGPSPRFCVGAQIRRAPRGFITGKVGPTRRGKRAPRYSPLPLLGRTRERGQVCILAVFGSVRRHADRLKKKGKRYAYQDSKFKIL